MTLRELNRNLRVSRNAYLDAFYPRHGAYGDTHTTAKVNKRCGQVRREFRALSIQEQLCVVKEALVNNPYGAIFNFVVRTDNHIELSRVLYHDLMLYHLATTEGMDAAILWKLANG